MFTSTRRSALAALATWAAGGIAGAFPAAGQAAGFPSRAVRMVALNPPGGVSDTLARIVGDRLGARWQQPVVVENKVGAAGIIGSEFVARAPADGHTLLIGFVGNLSINPALYGRKLRYDPLTDFAPISLIGRSPLVLLVHPGLAARTLADVLELARRQPGTIAYSSAGIGNGQHLAMEELARAAGVKFLHVPYKGGPQAAMGVASGDVQLTLTTIPSTLTLIRNGNVRALAVSTARRLPPLPGLASIADVPTIAESGMPGYEVTTWFGLVAPAGLPKPVLERITADLAAVLAEPDVKASIMEAGLIPESSSPEAFRQLIESEARRWQQVITANRITPE